MDLEMTGLDPGSPRHRRDRHAPHRRRPHDHRRGPDLVVHQPPEALAQMDQVVVEMHTRSGLLPAIAASTTSLAEAGAATLAFLAEHVAEPGTVPLCGNSIGTDRRFLAAYLPDIEAFFHYRSVDVSTIKELSRRWYPGVLSAAPRKSGGHRALDDIRRASASSPTTAARCSSRRLAAGVAGGARHPCAPRCPPLRGDVEGMRTRTARWSTMGR
jgi:oligoribonuclease